jgi:transcriptional regulator with GAF, ATPase, and Fis domain
MTEPVDDASARAQRDHALADTFVMLADTLVADYDVLELLDQLMTASVELIGVTAAGLLLDDQRGNLQVVASSSEETRLLEIYQLQNNEGPCLDCVRTGAAVTSQEIAAEAERWPLFAPRAAEAGFTSVAAVPMRLRDDVVGALNLFQSGDVEIGADKRRLGQAFADVATIGILQRRTVHRSAVLAEQLQYALNSRVVIEQAKGIVAERHQVDMGVAFDGLRRFARDHNLKLTDAASGVVAGDLDPDPTRRT